jgi:hypothetical protein
MGKEASHGDSSEATDLLRGSMLLLRIFPGGPTYRMQKARNKFEMSAQEKRELARLLGQWRRTVLKFRSDPEVMRADRSIPIRLWSMDYIV